MRTWFAFFAMAVAGLAGAQQRLIARLQPGANPYAMAHRYRLWLLGRTQNAPFVLFGIPPYVNSSLAQSQLSADPKVVWVEDNEDVSTPENQSATRGSTIPAVGGRSDLYAKNGAILTQIHWSSTLAGSPGRTVRIALLDTGLSMRQAYLWAHVDAGMSFVGGDVDDKPRGVDSNHNGLVDEAVGHGTMVAGIVDQIAPKVRLVIAKVADSDGNATAWSLIQGLAFAVTHGAEIANVSLGSPNQIAALTDVMDWCESNHLLVVAAIGNSNLREAFYPARISKVVCVAGLNPDDTKADFSNWEGSVRSSAPATGIVSQWWDGEMGVWDGTSFAAPMVAASLADCLRRKSGPVVLNTLRDAVKSSGGDLDALNPDYRGELGTLLDFQNLNAVLGSFP